MAILAVCSCGSQQRLPNSYEGKEVPCLKCGKMVRVGDPGASMSERRLEVGKVTLVARCEPSQIQQADAILRKVAAQQSSGVGLVDRVKVHMGWSQLQLQKRGSELLVCEADYSRNPYSDLREDISVVIKVGWGQADLAKKLSVNTMMCTFNQGINITEGCFSEQDLIMRRIKKPKDDDSGWFISPADPAKLAAADEKGEYDTIQSYQLLSRRPGMLSALILPLEFKARFSGDTLVSVLDPDNQEILPPG